MKLVILQNAYAHTLAGVRAMQADRQFWFQCLAESRSGMRLRALLGFGCFSHPKIWFDNTTPIVGHGSSSSLPPDFNHLRSVIDEKAPEIVIACGARALDAVIRCWGGPLLAVPHPAHRLLTTRLYELGARRLAAGIDGRIQIRQHRGLCRVAKIGDERSRTNGEREAAEINPRACLEAMPGTVAEV